MSMVSSSNLCPVCGYALWFSPWNGESASDEICPCCFIQFGYDDAAGGDTEARRTTYENWRQRWIDAGMPWKSRGTKPSDNWDPLEQLKAIGIG